MFKVSFEHIESVMNAIVDALQLRDHENDQIHDMIEGIDMFVIDSDDTHVWFENIESFYDTINAKISYIRACRYAETVIDPDAVVTTDNDDDIYECDGITFTIETIDAWETSQFPTN